MTTQSFPDGAGAGTKTPTPPARRRLADNVVCMFNEVRPPVAQAVGRRGRYPAIVTRLWSVPRLRPGAICIIRSDPDKDVNHGLIVRLIEHDDNGSWLSETIGNRYFVTNDGDKRRRVWVVNRSVLRRTVIH